MRRFEGFMKGVNLGGWISQFDAYSEEHFSSFIREEDIRSIKELGFDHVRVPVDYIVLSDDSGNMREEGFGYLDRCLSWCRKYDLRMLIDLHECYGYSFDPLKKDMDREKFFYDEDLQERFFDLWKEILSRYAGESDRVAFEPLNEVVLPSVLEAWNNILSRFIALVRSYSKDSWIVVGGVNYNNVLSVPLLSVPLDDRIVYNFHCYEPMVFSHQGAYWVEGMPLDYRVGYPRTLEEYRNESIRLSENLAGAVFVEGISEIGEGFFRDIFLPAVEKAKKDNVPLYCGEYGVIDKADNRDKIRWLRDIHKAFASFEIGSALWNYREKDFGFTDESFASIRTDFMKILK